jgi:3-phenylpropionate/trans-cinnamate dioxygenase ferredoxin reductase component
MGLVKHFDVLVVGAGHGGAQAAIALRKRGFAGTIGVVSAERDVPYERAQLSKDYLSGESHFDRIVLRPEAFWRECDIALLLGRTVMTVKPTARRVVLQYGDIIHYGVLVWAAGGRPRNLTCNGARLQGVFTLRARSDIDDLRQELPSAERVVIVGSGYIGLEAAAALSKCGKQVTVVEGLSRVLAREGGEALSRFYDAQHRAHGVEILLNAKVQSIERKGPRACGVRIKGDQLVPADLVIVDAGIAPACEPLLSAGARGGNGVVVDAYGRTSLPYIYALGDCAIHPSPYADGAMIRLESVQNACDMATTVAKAITRELEPYSAVPSFWSDQYDLRLRTAGLYSYHDDAVVRGDPASGSFSIIYRRKGRVVAVDCVNASNEFFHGRALVQNRVAAEPADLADSRVPLKELIASPAALEPVDTHSESFHGLRERPERDTVEPRAAHVG